MENVSWVYPVRKTILSVCKSLEELSHLLSHLDTPSSLSTSPQSSMTTEVAVLLRVCLFLLSQACSRCASMIESLPEPCGRQDRASKTP